MIATFKSPVDRDRHYIEIKKICSRRNWKVLKSRTFSTRSEQRTLGKMEAKKAKLPSESKALRDVVNDPMVLVLDGISLESGGPEDLSPRHEARSSLPRLKLGN